MVLEDSQATSVDAAPAIEPGFATFQSQPALQNQCVTPTWTRVNVLQQAKLKYGSFSHTSGFEKQHNPPRPPDAFGRKRSVCVAVIESL
eukprot:1157013-Pelagomonas_calceolata.AAC.18